MNGATALIETLGACGVEVCFTNPGTTEMHLVAALDRVPAMRGVLALFEGVVTGAADGYGRMRGKPAATLLHLGPGLANGIANLHNARRASTPIVNLVGQHALSHIAFDSPLTSDIDGLARTVSGWLKTATSPATLTRDGAEAVAAACARPGGIATLVLPADIVWSENVAPAPPLRRQQASLNSARLDEAVHALEQARQPVLLLGGDGLSGRGLEAAGRIAAATGAQIMSETFFARARRGAGLVPFARLPYFPNEVMDKLAGADAILLAGARPPAAFFAYPGQPSALWPKEAHLTVLCDPEADLIEALEALADRLPRPAPAPERQGATRPERPRGKLDTRSAGAAIAALLPEEAIVVDEGATSSPPAYVLCAGAPPHDVLTLTGGSIGQGLPLAVGCAIACPERKVLCLEGDGSGSYTLQALWTMAREKLDVTTVIFANRSYAILNVEMFRAGINAGPKAAALLDLHNPAPDWVKLAQGYGVDACRAETAEEFTSALERALSRPGPQLIEAVI